MENNSINDILGIENSKTQRTSTPDTNKYRYPALISIASIYKALAWIIGIATIIATFYFLSESNKLIFGLVTLVIGGLLALGLAAISEVIKVFLDIEYNTRKWTNT